MALTAPNPTSASDTPEPTPAPAPHTGHPARLVRLTQLALVAVLASACGSPTPPAPVRGAPQAAPPGAAAPGSAQPSLPTPAPPPGLALPQRPPRSWDDYRVQAARRIVAANPQVTHLGEVQQPALAIPVLEIELNADGSVRRVQVLRRPSQAHDTVQLAIDAVHRAAPFAPVSHLPRPWKFAEVFLFNDQRRFKPRTLDD